MYRCTFHLVLIIFITALPFNATACDISLNTPDSLEKVHKTIIHNIEKVHNERPIKKEDARLKKMKITSECENKFEITSWLSEIWQPRSPS